MVVDLDKIVDAVAKTDERKIMLDEPFVVNVGIVGGQEPPLPPALDQYTLTHPCRYSPCWVEME